MLLTLLLHISHCTVCRATSKMVAEAAICLALDEEKLPKTYGILTPGSAMGSVLRKRLEATNMQFYISK